MMQLNKNLCAVAMHTFRHALYTAYMLSAGNTQLIWVTGAAVFIYAGKFRENQTTSAPGAVLIEADQFWGRLTVPGGKTIAHSRHCNTISNFNATNIAFFKQFLIFHRFLAPFSLLLFSLISCYNISYRPYYQKVHPPLSQPKYH